MTEWLVTAAAPILGWVVSVEYRLGQLMAMNKNVEKTAERVDKIYELLGGKDADDRPEETEE